MKDPRINGTRRPPAYLQDKEFKPDGYGIRRILIDGQRPVYELGGHMFSTRTEAARVAQFAADLVGVSEVAQLLGWDRRKVATYAARGAFPEPIVRVAAGPLWTRRQIEEYKRQRQQ